MKFNQVFFFSILLVTIFFVGSINAQADTNPQSQTQQSSTFTPNQSSTFTPDQSSTFTSTRLDNPLKASSLADLISEILGYVVKIGSIFLTFMIIYTGFQFIVARGNEEKVSQARSALLWTVVGGLLLLGAQVIASAIAATVESL